MPKRPVAPDPAALAGLSAAAVRGFLLQAAELDSWTRDYAAKALGIEKRAAQEVIDALQLIGYVEPVAGRRNQYRTTQAGKAVSGLIGKERPKGLPWM